MVHRVNPVLKVHKAHPDFLVNKEIMAYKALLGYKATMAHVDCKVLLVQKDTMVHKVLQDHAGPKAIMAHRDRKARLVYQVQQDRKVHRASMVQRDRLVPSAPKGLTGLKASLENGVHKVTTAHKAHLVLLVHRV